METPTIIIVRFRNTDVNDFKIFDFQRKFPWTEFLVFTDVGFDYLYHKLAFLLVVHMKLYFTKLLISMGFDLYPTRCIKTQLNTSEHIES